MRRMHLQDRLLLTQTESCWVPFASSWTILTHFYRLLDLPFASIPLNDAMPSMRIVTLKPGDVVLVTGLLSAQPHNIAAIALSFWGSEWLPDRCGSMPFISLGQQTLGFMVRTQNITNDLKHTWIKHSVGKDILAATPSGCSISNDLEWRSLKSIITATIPRCCKHMSLETRIPVYVRFFWLKKTTESRLEGSPEEGPGLVLSGPSSQAKPKQSLVNCICIKNCITIKTYQKQGLTV